jgi:hypothetical protein
MCDLRVGASLMEYSDRIVSQITPEMTAAALEAQQAFDQVDKDTVYYGRARPEMDMFYRSYLAHTQKIQYFFQIASEFLGEVLASFEYTDDQLKTVIQMYQDGDY